MRKIPIDKVLNLWARGFSASRIVQILGEAEGIPFRVESITNVIVRARKNGDYRAKKRRHWWKGSQIKTSIEEEEL